MCYSALAVSGHYCLQVTIAPAYPTCVKGECDSLTGSHLISGLITVACSNLNEESRVSRVPTLATHGVA